MAMRITSRLAASSLALALAAVSCKPGAGAHTASAGSSAAPAGTHLAAGLAAEGSRALASGYAPQAIALTEKAVSLDPRDADDRVQLGRAYLMAGRFRSAVESFEDARALGRDDGQLAISLALAQAGAGDVAGARATLAGAVGKSSAADRGLALALVGDPGAVPLLETAAREAGAEATVRQNLALAYALAGRWGEARTTAAQDVNAAELDGRMTQWASLAGAETPASRIAGLFNLPAAEDPGMPTALALAGVPHSTAAASAVAIPETAPQPEPAATVVASAEPNVGEAPVTVAAVPAPAPSADDEPAPVARLVAPSVPVPPAPVAPLLRADPRPAKTRLAAGALLRVPVARQDRGSWVVQLGAFSTPARVETAWSRAQARVGSLTSYTPSGGTVSRGALALHRLSLAGFGTRAAAVRVCEQVRRAGGDCFVRTQAGDAPVEWVSRKREDRFASR